MKSEMEKKKKSRLGIVRIANEILENPEVISLLSEMEIIKEQPSFSFADVTEYLAIHPEFCRICQGEVIPEYVFIFEKNGDCLRRKAVKEKPVPFQDSGFIRQS